MKNAKTIYIYLFGALSLLGGLIFGFDIGAMTGAVLFIKDEFTLANQEIGLVVGASLIGCAIGSLISAPLSKFLGRRTMIFLSCLIYFVAAFGLSFVPNLNQLHLLRLMIGIGIGIASFSIPIYIAEISPKENRGALVSLYQFAITLGILIAFCISIFNASNFEWRSIFLFDAVVALLFLCFIPMLPRSPRWLYLKGYKEKALQVLQKIRPAHLVDQEMKEISQNANQKKEGIWKFRTPILIGLGLSMFQQITGINAVVFYAPTIIQKTGIESHQFILMLTAAIGVVNTLATLFCILIIDRVGRRSLLLTSVAGMAASLLLLSVSSGIVVTMISLMGFIAFFALGIGPLFWVVCSEIFPTEVRGIGMSLATLVNWLSNFAVSSTFLVLADILSFSGVAILYAAITLLSFIFIYFFVPETKGLSLEEIEELFSVCKEPCKH